MNSPNNEQTNEHKPSEPQAVSSGPETGGPETSGCCEEVLSGDAADDSALPHNAASPDIAARDVAAGDVVSDDAVSKSSDADLATVLASHGVGLPSEQVAMLQRYCVALWEWNEKINLTRHTDYEKFVTRDLVDSLTIAKFLEEGERVLDVGTGGGVPGILLAIVRPDLDVVLCESVGKKAMAVTDIVRQLGIDVAVLHARAEDVLSDQCFNTLVIRAVARLKKLLQWFKPHWSRFDRLLILKGPAWVDERGEARHFSLLNQLALRKLVDYSLPESGAQSVLLQICPQDRLRRGDRCRITRE